MIIQNAKLNTALFPEPAAQTVDGAGEGFSDVLNAANVSPEPQRNEATSASRTGDDGREDRVTEAPARSSDERSEQRAEDTSTNETDDPAADVAGADQQTKQDQQASDQKQGDQAESTNKSAKTEGESKPVVQTSRTLDVKLPETQTQASTANAQAAQTDQKVTDEAAAKKQAQTQVPVIEASRPVIKQADASQAQVKAETPEDVVKLVKQPVNPQQVQPQQNAEQSQQIKSADQLQSQQAAQQVQTQTQGQMQQQSADQQQTNQQQTAPQQVARQPQTQTTDAADTSEPVVDTQMRQFAGTTNTTEAPKPQANAVDAVQVRVDMSDAAPTPTASTEGRAVAGTNVSAGTPSVVGLPEIDTEQVMQRTLSGVRGAVAQKGGTVNLRLSPPELGVLRIQVKMTNGTVQATFGATNQAVGSLLNQHMSSLRHALESHGLTVENLQVQVQQPSNQNQTSTQQDAQQSPSDGRSRGAMSDGNNQGQQSGGRDESDQPRSFDRELLDLVA